jgi:hypothetical protein
MPPTAYYAHATVSVARAAWNGDQFVVVAHHRMTVTWPSILPGEFEREIARRDVYSFSGVGQLVVEGRVLVDPLPGGSDRRIDLPDSWTCVYANAGEPSLAARPKVTTQRRALVRTG